MKHVREYEASAPGDYSGKKHKFRDTFEQKENSIKIHQISATGDLENGLTVYALGHDGKVYYWDSMDGLWLLDKNPTTEDLGEVSDDPFKKVEAAQNVA